MHGWGSNEWLVSKLRYLISVVFGGGGTVGQQVELIKKKSSFFFFFFFFFFFWLKCADFMLSAEFQIFKIS